MSLNDYKKEKDIGSGSFGVVELYRRKRDDYQCVIKLMKTDNVEVRKSAETETRLLCYLKHPNIVEYIDCFQQSNDFYLVMEYCSGGDLAKKLKNQGATKLAESKIIQWTFELCLALKHIHDRNIIHRDLKPQNVFLTSSDVAKIGDFGISTKLLKTVDAVESVVGTPIYLSPEIARNQKYDYKTDVWSLGCVVYEMMALNPAVDPMELLMNGKWVIRPMPTGYSPELTKLTDTMMTINAAERPSVSEIIVKDLLQLKAMTNASVLAEYDKIREIGKGAFGEAWLYRQKKDKKEYVLKKTSFNGDETKASAIVETQMLCSLQHQNIVRYIDCFMDSSQFCILMEYCGGGDMFTRLQKQATTKLPEAKITQWTLELCLAIQYIHDRFIIHRDIKPQNIFLTKDESVKLGDFGIARVLKPGDLATTIVGSPLYASPEIIRGGWHDFKTDIWSLGLCVYQMMALKPAVDQDALLRDGKRIIGPMPTGYSSELTKLTDKMLTIEANHRPTIHEVLDSELFRTHYMAPRRSSFDMVVAIQGLRIEYNRAEAIRERQQAETDLLALGYKIDSNSKVVDAVNGSAYVYSKTGDKEKDEQNYQDLAKALTAHVQATLQIDFNMSKLYIPVDADPNEPQTFILISNDYRTNSDKLMMFVQGNGFPRVGEWARKVMINDSLDAGCQIRWVERAYKDGFSVILLNPNGGEDTIIGGKCVPVRENKESYDHVQYIWKNVIPISRAKHIAIVAHSYGGANILELASRVVDDFIQRVFVIAFADSVHTIHKTTPKKLIDFCQKNARNWVSSDDPLDKPQKTPVNDIPQVSAGDLRHEWTTYKSFNSMFAFINSLTP